MDWKRTRLREALQMFKCPLCGPDCPAFDELKKVCIYNTKLIEPEEALEWNRQAMAEGTPEECFDDMD